MWRRQQDIDALLTRIRELVRMRDDRRRAGAGPGELERRNVEIAHLHSRLAEQVRRRLHDEKARHGSRA